jgi:hypothetical protein
MRSAFCWHRRLLAASKALARSLECKSFAVQPTESEIARIEKASSCLQPSACGAAKAALAVQCALRLKTAACGRNEPTGTPPEAEPVGARARY